MISSEHIERFRQKWAKLAEQATPNSREKAIYEYLTDMAYMASGKTPEEQDCNLADTLSKQVASTSDAEMKKLLKQCANEFIAALPYNLKYKNIEMIQ